MNNKAGQHTASAQTQVRHTTATGPLWRSASLFGRLVLLTLAVSTTGSLATATELDSLLEDLNSIRRNDQIPGIALTLVSGKSVLWCGGIGYADPNRYHPVTPDTAYRVQALSRTLAGLAVLLAAERGALSLDDRLRAVLPEVSLDNPWEETHPVRIAHLLEHTAGLRDRPAGVPPGAQDAVEAPLSEAERQCCHWPPGLFPSWSRVGVRFAIAALEHSIDESYPAFLKRHLFGPLDLQQTRITTDAVHRGGPAGTAEAYSAVAHAEAVPSSAPALISTPRELAALLQLLLNGGTTEGRRLVSEASIERLATPRTPLAARQGLRFGFGAGNVPSIYRGFLFHGQSGDAGAQLSHYAYSQRLGLGYVVIINARQPAALERLRTRIQDYLIAEHRPHRPPPAKVDRQQLVRLGGKYRALTAHPPTAGGPPRAHQPLQVLLIDGRLYMRRGSGAPRELLPVTAHLFRRPEQPVATIAFSEYGDDVYLQGPFGNYRRIAAAADSDGTQR